MIRLALHDLATMAGDQKSLQAANQKLASGQNKWLDEITDFIDNYYYDPSNPSSFSTFEKLYKQAKAQRGVEPSTVKTWLEQQDAYTLHKPIRKRFPRNPYTVNNILGLWEADLVDVQALAKHNDGHRYLLTVIDVFTKYLHIVPLKSKTAKAVSEAFESVLNDDRYMKPHKRRPIRLRTDKGKEFLGSGFQKLLKREGIQFLVCKNPDIKCSCIERAHRTIRAKLYKYFTFKNSYRYIDVLADFVTGYNATVHSSTGIAPASVTDSDVLAIWKRLQRKRERVIKAKYSVGQHVRINKEKATFAKSAEQNFSTEIFRIAKVIPRTPRPVYELEDLNKQPIDGSFYQEELTPVVVTKQTQFKIDKILSTRVRRGIKEHKVRWLGYGPEFDSWVKASDVVKL